MKEEDKTFLMNPINLKFKMSQCCLQTKHTSNQPARHFQRSLHCEWNTSVTVAGITKWLGHTIHRIHGYNWYKFEEITPAGLGSGEWQSSCNLVVKTLYIKPLIRFVLSAVTNDCGLCKTHERMHAQKPRKLESSLYHDRATDIFKGGAHLTSRRSGVV